jgi:hypothetical protein
MDPENAVRVQVNVELAPVRAELDGALERRNGVLWAFAGGPAVGDDFRAAHSDSLTSQALSRPIL